MKKTDPDSLDISQQKGGTTRSSKYSFPSGHPALVSGNSYNGRSPGLRILAMHLPSRFPSGFTIHHYHIQLRGQLRNSQQNKTEFPFIPDFGEPLPVQYSLTLKIVQLVNIK